MVIFVIYVVTFHFFFLLWIFWNQVDVHMTLSQLGCMQKLLDFLRTNTNNELIEIIGETVTWFLQYS